MFGRRSRAVVDGDRLRRVVNLIPEYVDALIDERMGRRAMVEGLDGREIHGPAERRLVKIEARISELIGGQSERANEKLNCSAMRRIFLDGLSQTNTDKTEGLR